MKNDLIILARKGPELDESQLADVVGGGPSPEPWLTSRIRFNGFVHLDRFANFQWAVALRF